QPGVHANRVGHRRSLRAGAGEPLENLPVRRHERARSAGAGAATVSRLAEECVIVHRTRGLEEVTGPRSPAQVRQRGSAPAQGPAVSLPALQRQAGNAAVAALLTERMPGAGSGPAPMVQRVLSPSATYAPHGAALTAL